MYASVVVEVDAPGLRQPFTYRVPEALREGLAPGACVVVPFGKQTAIGYVIGLGEEIPADLAEEAIRDIAARVSGDGASLPPAVLATAKWMAQTYFTDLAQAVRCVIPNAQAAHVVRRVALAPGWEAALPEISTLSHRQVILALSNLKGGAATEAELSALLGGVRVASPLQILRKKGILEDRWTVEPPRAGARKVKALRLLRTKRETLPPKKHGNIPL